MLVAATGVHDHSTVGDRKTAFFLGQGIYSGNAEKISTGNTHQIHTTGIPVLLLKELLGKVVVGVKKGTDDEQIVLVLVFELMTESWDQQQTIRDSIAVEPLCKIEGARIGCDLRNVGHGIAC